MKCTQCHERNPSGAKQCLHCEAPLGDNEEKDERIPKTARHAVMALAGLLLISAFFAFGPKDGKEETVCSRQRAEISKYQADIGWERDTPAERQFRTEKRSQDIANLKIGEDFWSPEDIQKLRCYRRVGVDALSPAERATSNPDNWEEPKHEPQRF